MAVNKLLLLLLLVAALCAFSVAAAQSTSPAQPSAQGTMPSAGPSGATQPAAALPPSSAAITASKKFPLPAAAGGEYLPAAEVASALPEPTPDQLPSAASLGFGEHGDECCGGGGYGWFGGPGGFGPGTYGYNGPLYFGAAPPARNVLLPSLVVACVSAAVFYYH